MKKTITIIGAVAILIGAVAMGAISSNDFEHNFQKAAKNLVGAEIKVLKKQPLESFKGAFLVLGEFGGESFPLLVSENGKYFIALSGANALSERDSEFLEKEMGAIFAQKEKADKAALAELFASIPNDRFLLLGNDSKKPTKIVVSDPDCPYCRDLLNNIESDLKEANLKIIFAPTHDKNASIKAQLAQNECQKAKSDTEKIAILRKYYKDFELSTAQKSTDFSIITDNQKRIFSSGLVNYVPFVFELESAK